MMCDQAATLQKLASYKYSNNEPINSMDHTATTAGWFDLFKSKPEYDYFKLHRIINPIIHAMEFGEVNTIMEACGIQGCIKEHPNNNKESFNIIKHNGFSQKQESIVSVICYREDGKNGKVYSSIRAVYSGGAHSNMIEVPLPVDSASADTVDELAKKTAELVNDAIARLDSKIAKSQKHP